MCSAAWPVDGGHSMPAPSPLSRGRGGAPGGHGRSEEIVYGCPYPAGAARGPVRAGLSAPRAAPPGQALGAAPKVEPWQDAERCSLAQAAQEGPEARRRPPLRDVDCGMRSGRAGSSQPTRCRLGNGDRCPSAPTPHPPTPRQRGRMLGLFQQPVRRCSSAGADPCPAGPADARQGSGLGVLSFLNGPFARRADGRRGVLQGLDGDGGGLAPLARAVSIEGMRSGEGDPGAEEATPSRAARARGRPPRPRGRPAAGPATIRPRRTAASSRYPRARGCGSGR